jgi:signal transduction histidine kinase
MAVAAPRAGVGLGTRAARHLGLMPRVIGSTHGLPEIVRGSAELVAEAVRADAVIIRLGGPGGTEIVHVRRPWGAAPTNALPTRVAVPLVLRGRRLGMLTALRARRRPFPKTAGALIGAFAGPIAMAIDNARLFDALQDRLGDVARLAEASEAIAALDDLDAVGSQIARHAALLVSAERAVVLLVDHDLRALVAQPPGYGFRASRLRRLRLPLEGGSASARVLESGRPFIASDIAGDRRHLGPGDESVGDRSVVIVPLRAAAHSLGVLRVSNKRAGLFTRQDARLLGVFAAQSAVALENAMLYQEAVREREQLKELERLKSHFLSLVSHELRTPLASIKASAEVLLATAPSGTAEAHLRLLRNVDRSSDRLSALISDLLDLVQLEGGRVELQRERVDLRPVAEEAATTVRPLADERKQSIRVTVPARACPVAGDRRRLEQIAMNLLTNAVKYGPPGSTIELDVRRCRGGRLRLAVHDSGPGIPADEHRSIFERFYRRDSEETRRASGTGLGLPIAKALTELHGGQVIVESAPGRGSTFAVLLPELDDEDPHRRRRS